jgi:hypothetical protein
LFLKKLQRVQKKTPHGWCGVQNGNRALSRLLHQEHLAGAFDGAVELALVVRGEPGVFAREDAALVGDELAEQGGVFEVEGVDGEIDLRLGPWSAGLHGAATSAFFFFRMSFAWHSLLDFAVQSVATEERVELFEFDFLGLKFFVASGHVARRGLAFLARFGALDGNNFASHKVKLRIKN